MLSAQNYKAMTTGSGIAIEEALALKGIPQFIANARKDWMEKGRPEALEEAAKVAKEWFRIDRTKYGNPNPEFMDLIADKIRALRPSPKPKAEEGA